NERPLRSDEPDLRHFDSASYQRGYLSVEDQQIGNEFGRLCQDARSRDCLAGGGAPRRPSLPLAAVAPSLFRGLKAVDLPAFGITLDDPTACIQRRAPFFCVAGSSGTPQDRGIQSLAIHDDRWVASFAKKLAILTRQTQARANALVAADRRSYSRS